MVLWPNLVGVPSGLDAATFAERALNAMWDRNDGPFFLTIKKAGQIPDHEVFLYLDKYGYKLKIEHKAGVAKRPFFSG